MNSELKSLLNKTYKGLQKSDFEDPSILYQGKVRDVVDLGEELILTVSDRISAFDCILGTIPAKGQILNQMALYWFNQTRDIIENHLLEEITPRSVRVKKCQVLPVEVIVRGYLTGSAWRDYQEGRPVSGISLPEGMRMDQKFSSPLITPSTKAQQGDHDQPISCEEIVRTGLVEDSLWKEVEEKALALFARGTKLAARQGLILVDTKYEFGLYQGKLVLVDEVHTPDSSRYWFADSYQELFNKGLSQRKLDKEHLRGWLMDQGFMGEGDPPVLPDTLRLEVAEKYREAYHLLTGEKIQISTSDPQSELTKILSYL